MDICLSVTELPNDDKPRPRRWRRSSESKQRAIETMVHMKQDEFLTALTRLFSSTRDKGSLSITFKRVPVKGATVSEGSPPPYECLVRARTDKKKLSTSVRWITLRATAAEC